MQAMPYTNSQLEQFADMAGRFGTCPSCRKNNQFIKCLSAYCNSGKLAVASGDGTYPGACIRPIFHLFCQQLSTPSKGWRLLCRKAEHVLDHVIASSPPSSCGSIEQTSEGGKHSSGFCYFRLKAIAWRTLFPSLLQHCNSVWVRYRPK